MYRFHYKGNVLGESLKVARGAPVFRGTDFEVLKRTQK